MTTTPLPPFPRPAVFDPGRFGVAYSQTQMVDFATAARADLEAENAKLWHCVRNSLPLGEEGLKARAALKETP